MIYLNNAATSWPKPEAVYQAVDRHTRRPAGDFARSNGAEAQHNSELLFECRSAVAALFGVPKPDQVIFTCNATDSINTALKGLLKRGDHLIISDMEHNAVLRPAMKMQSDGLIEVSVAESDKLGRLDPAAVKSLLRPNTALVEAIHVSNVTGVENDIAPLADVCRQRGVPFMIDASQSAGNVDLDVVRDGVDILAAPGHKSLLGPPGTGVLYLSPRLEVDTVREGGTGGDSLRLEQPAHAPDRFESGTPNLPGIAGLLEGVRFVSQQGVTAIADHKRKLVAILRSQIRRLPGLTEYCPADQVPTVYAFAIRGRDPADLCEYLAQGEIVVRGGFHCALAVHRKMRTLESGMVRVSPGPFSTPDDMLACADALHRYTRGQP